MNKLHGITIRLRLILVGILMTAIVAGYALLAFLVIHNQKSTTDTITRESFTKLRSEQESYQILLSIQATLLPLPSLKTTGTYDDATIKKKSKEALEKLQVLNDRISAKFKASGKPPANGDTIDLIEHYKEFAVSLTEFVLIDESLSLIYLGSLAEIFSQLEVALNQSIKDEETHVGELVIKSDENYRSASLILILALVAAAATAFLISLIMGKTIAGALSVTLNAFKKISKGDLTTILDEKGRDEIASLGREVNVLLESISSMIGLTRAQAEKVKETGFTLSSNAEQTSSSLIEINANIENTQQQMNQLSDSVAKTASAVEELSASISQMAKLTDRQEEILKAANDSAIDLKKASDESAVSAHATSRVSADLLKISDDGKSKLESVIESISRIAHSSDELLEATAIILNIAKTTNLLAMNASIEAAHAGEAGRGFEVVANEIRKLAEQTSQQSSQISSELQRIKQDIDSAEIVSREAGISFENIFTGIRDVNSIIESVKVSADKSSLASGQIREHIVQFSELGFSIAGSAKEMDQGNSTIMESVALLQKVNLLVSQNLGEITLGTREISEASLQVSNLSSESSTQVRELLTETEKFTLKAR